MENRKLGTKTQLDKLIVLFNNIFWQGCQVIKITFEGEVSSQEIDEIRELLN